MREQTPDNLWTEVAAEVREARHLRPLRLDEIGKEMRGTGSNDLTEEHISNILAFAIAKDSIRSAARRHAGADPGVTRLLDEVTSSGLVSSAEIRAVDEEQRETSTRRTSDDYLSEFARRNLLRAFQPQRLERGLEKGVLFADYLLLNTIGMGGMGDVFRALHLRMNRIVALKVVSSKVSGLRDNLTRFDSEVKALAKLNHPNIVSAYDASESGGVPYLVMEYIDGSDLERLVYRIGPLNPTLACSYLLQVARGLDYAHGQGVIHRDVKPSNILVGSDAVVRVSDLGLAKLVQFGCQTDHDLDATKAGTAVGTYSYMSPEQAAGSGDVDARSDIYGLGCTLFFLLLGRPPAIGSTNEAKMQWHREGVIPSLRAHLPGIPERLDAIFRRMLAKSREDRPQSMAEVIKELEDCQSLLRDVVVVEATAEWQKKPDARGKSAAVAPAVAPAVARRWRPRLIQFVVVAVLAGLSIGLLVHSFSADEGKNPLIPVELATGFTNDIGMSLALIQPGEFWMGSNRGIDSEQPRHKVYISQSFYMGTHEVNRRQYQVVMAPEQPIPEPQHGDDEPASVDLGALPMVNVTWDEAREFCRRLSERLAEKRARRAYRLPTEAEWEYCCRAGTETAFCTGDDITTMEHANFGAKFRAASTRFPGSPRLLEVGSFPPNQFGLHDMHGNALEWCKDRYGVYDRDAATDPQGPKVGEHRVVRGGATTINKQDCRSASRRYKYANESSQLTGFRVVCVIETE